MYFPPLAGSNFQTAGLCTRFFLSGNSIAGYSLIWFPPSTRSDLLFISWKIASVWEQSATFSHLKHMMLGLIDYAVVSWKQGALYNFVSWNDIFCYDVLRVGSSITKMVSVLNDRCGWVHNKTPKVAILYAALDSALSRSSFTSLPADTRQLTNLRACKCATQSPIPTTIRTAAALQLTPPPMIVYWTTGVAPFFNNVWLPSTSIKLTGRTICI
jgi:hypothetical protein